MMLKVAMTILLSQYVRSRIDDSVAGSQCLWWPENTVIELRQSVDGNPETPGDAEFTAFSASVATWATQLNSCSSLRLQEGARTQTRKIGFFDGGSNENVALFRLRKCANVVPRTDGCWTDDDCGNQYDCWQHQDGAIAITTTSFNPDTGRILDSDIEYNTPSFIFSTVDTPPCPPGLANTNCVATDVQNTTTHELGHLLGLSHSPSSSSTMSFRASAGELSKRTLDADTARFVCDVYPAGAAAKTCVVNTVSSELGKSLGPGGCGCSEAPGLLAAFGALAFGLRKRRAR
ncbi:MAG TPA: myxosortase-dependent metalloprotease, MXAN_2677/MXAN_2678 family [Archangium sp.]